MAEWTAAYTRSALDFIAGNVTSKRVALKLFEYRELLEEVPDLGRAYDPEYAAARTPFPCRVVAVADTSFSLYYLKEEDVRRIVIFCIEYQRIDPTSRFSSIDWAIAE